jgi:hypothetical protein
MITGTVLAGLSLPLLLSQKEITLAKGVLQSTIGSFFCFDLLGLEKQTFEKERKPLSGFLAGFPGGIAAALLSAFVPMTAVLMGVFLVVFLRLCYRSPESGMLLSCLLMPFSPDGWVLTMLLSVAFFYLVKLFRGKRNLKTGFYVWTFFGYLIFPVFCGLLTLTSGGVWQTTRFLTLSLAFFLPSVLFGRGVWIKRASGVLTLCGAIGAIWAVLVYGSAFVPQRYLSLLPFMEALEERFADFSSFGAFLVALSPMLAVRIFTRERGRGRVLLLLSGIMTIAAVVFSRDPGVWICYLFAVALYLLFRERNTLLPLLLAALGGTLIYVFILPDQITRQIKLFSNGFFVDFERTSELLLESAKRFFTGVGLGSVEEQGNFYTHILTEQGLVSLLVLSFLLLGLVSYGVYAYYKNRGVSSERKTQLGGFAIGLTVLLASGVFVDFWQDEKMLFLLFFLAGVVLSCGKVLCSQGEKEMRISETDRDYFYLPTRSSVKKSKKTAKPQPADSENAAAPKENDDLDDVAKEPSFAERAASLETHSEKNQGGEEQ